VKKHTALAILFAFMCLISFQGFAYGAPKTNGGTIVVGSKKLY